MTEKYLAKINEFLYGKDFFYSPSTEQFYSLHHKMLVEVFPVRKGDTNVDVVVSIWHAKLGRYLRTLYTLKASEHGFIQRFEKKVFVPAMAAYAKQEAENQRYAQVN